MPSPATPRATLPGRRVLEGLALALVAATLAWYVPANQHLQWDLRAYSYAARAALAGFDPYRLDVLTAVAGRPWNLPFLYPPVTLPAFLPMAWLSFDVLAAVWMTQKLVALGTLGWLWSRRFDVGVTPLVLVLVLLFGFDGAALFDLRAGNIAIFEALLVWTGLALWVFGRPVAFAACIVAASLFKLAPIGFLALLLVPGAGRRARPALLLLALSVFAAAIVLPEFVGPAAHWHALGAALRAPRLGGIDDPSALALFDALPVIAYLPLPDPGLALWCGYALAVAGIGVLWWRRAAHAWGPRERVFAAAMLWMLLTPRPMCYGYVMVIGSVLALAPRPFRGRAGALALALVLSAQALLRLAGFPPAGVWQEQLPFLTLLGLWLLRVREDLVSRPHAAARGEETPSETPAVAA